MKPRTISERVHALGAVDWDNRLFDALIPLPDGTTYNAYLVRGSERTALVDTVEPSMAGTLLEQVEGVGRLDVLVSLHTEQDHSGSIPAVLERHPEATVLCSAKARGMLGEHLGVPEARIRVVKDGEEVSLGDRTLRFLSTPWAHWPETISALLVEEGILFSCDLFGSHLAGSDLYAADRARVLEAAKRYYAEIMMPFAKHIAKSLAKVRAAAPRVIAPSHGPVYDDPALILDAYEEWVGGPPRNRAVVAFVSMHESTRTMVDRLVGALVDRGVGVDRFDLVVTDLGKLAMALVDAATVVLATPTVLDGPHPHAVHAAYLVNTLAPKARWIATMGSYGWKSKAADLLATLTADLGVTRHEPLFVKGRPTGADLESVDALAGKIAAAHAEAGLV